MKRRKSSVLDKAFTAFFIAKINCIGLGSVMFFQLAIDAQDAAIAAHALKSTAGCNGACHGSMIDRVS